MFRRRLWTCCFTGFIALTASAQSSAQTSTEELEKALTLLMLRVNVLETMVAPGSVLAFSGTKIPEGWVACDGAEYSQDKYNKLYEAIGGTYNTQTDPTRNSPWPAPAAGNFRVPDYRGIFLRSEGTNSLGQKTVLGGFQDDGTAWNSLSLSVGWVAQADKKQHSHPASASTPYNYLSDSPSGSEGRMRGADGFYHSTNKGVSVSIGATNTDHTHDITKSGGENETRPQNVGVKYIIRVK